MVHAVTLQFFSVADADTDGGSSKDIGGLRLLVEWIGVDECEGGESQEREFELHYLFLSCLGRVDLKRCLYFSCSMLLLWLLMFFPASTSGRIIYIGLSASGVPSRSPVFTLLSHRETWPS